MATAVDLLDSSFGADAAATVFGVTSTQAAAAAEEIDGSPDN
jgi:hypothetical protein